MKPRDDRPVLVWDVMDTLVHEPFYREMPAFFGLSLQELLQAKHPTSWLDFELGRIDEATHLRTFFRDGRDFDHGGLKRCVAEAYRWLPGMEKLLSELADAGHAMHVLSNYPVWYRTIEERLGLSRFLAWSFVSCDLGLRKPDSAIYRVAAEKLGADPGRLVFVDDRAANVEAAREEGWRAIQFEDAARTRGALVELGVVDA